MPADEIEERGVRAIIFLQALAGKDETEQQARLGWKTMTTPQRQQTMMAYNALNRNDTH